MAGTGIVNRYPLVILLLPYVAGLLLGPGAPVGLALFAALRFTLHAGGPAVPLTRRQAVPLTRATAGIAAALAGVLLQAPAERPSQPGPRLMLLEGTIVDGPWPSRSQPGTFFFELLPPAGSTFCAAGSPLPVVADGYPGTALEPGARVRFPGEVVLRNGAIRAATPGRLVDVLARAPPCAPRRLLYRMRRALKACLDRSLPQRTAPVCASVLLGTPGAVDRERKDLFRRTGTIHLLAISGLHVGIVTVALSRLLVLVTAPGRTRSLLLIAALATLCLLTGGRTPVIRASVAGVLHVLSRGSGRATSSTAFLLNAALLLLAVDPGACRSISFQLSFAGYAAILLFLQRAPALRTDGLSRALLGPVRTAGVSLAAWCGTAPLVAFHFGRIVPVAPLVNIAAVPIFSLALCAAFAHLLVALPFPEAARVTAVVVDLLFGVLFRLLDGAAALLPGPVATAPPPKAVLYLYYGIGSAFLLAPARRRRRGVTIERPQSISSK